MNYLDKFRVSPGSHVRLADSDPGFSDKNEDKSSARKKLTKLKAQMGELQFRLYAEQQRSLLICLQAPDAAGKDGVVRHVIGSMNPQGCRVVPFKQPSAEELAHDFLWRVEHATPRFVIPSDRKWFRNLAVSQIIVETMEKMRIELPAPSVDIDGVRRKYHEAVGRSLARARKSK